MATTAKQAAHNAEVTRKLAGENAVRAKHSGELARMGKTLRDRGKNLQTSRAYKIRLAKGLVRVGLRASAPAALAMGAVSATRHLVEAGLKSKLRQPSRMAKRESK